ncbi:MAG: hypothetical protein IJ748_00910 [Bacteroidales bacterium]|nr:hypothetical protein [Bacteroidales bacterium]
MKQKILFTVCLFIFISFKLSAQIDNIPKNQTSLPSIQDNGQTVIKEKFHSPGKAALFSTFAPGLGQIYNKQTWKTAVVYAGLGVVSYFAISNYNNMSKFKDEYYNRINNNGNLLADYTTYSDESIYKLYEAYKDNFHLMVIIGAGIYAAQILDAYVYGYLFSFDISEDISLNIIPSVFPFKYGGVNCNSLGLKLSLKF